MFQLNAQPLADAAGDQVNQPQHVVAGASLLGDDEVSVPVADDGLYAIADVGAGTTDIAFFRLSKLLSDNLAIYS